MPEAMQKDTLIEEALSLEDLFLKDRDERIQYILRLRAHMDEASHNETIRILAEARGRREGLSEGRREGLSEGRREERLAMARKMLAASMPITQVTELTDLPLEEVQDLRH